MGRGMLVFEVKVDLDQHKILYGPLDNDLLLERMLGAVSDSCRGVIYLCLDPGVFLLRSLMWFYGSQPPRFSP